MCLVGAAFGQVLETVRQALHPRRRRRPAAVLRLQHRVQEPHDVELDLEPDDEFVTLGSQLIELPAQQAASRERDRLAVLEVGVGQHRSGAVDPGKPPAANGETIGWLVVSKMVVTSWKSFPSAKLRRNSGTVRDLPRMMPCWSPQPMRTCRISPSSSVCRI